MSEIFVSPLRKVCGTLSCSLYSKDLAELHRFARRVGKQRSSFIDGKQSGFPHYDLTPAQRRSALQIGAQEDHST